MRDLIRNSLVPRLVDEWLAAHAPAESLDNRQDFLLESLAMPPGYYSTEEVARQLGVTRATIHLWITNGRVDPPRHTVGRALAWSEADIDRLRRAQKKIKFGRPRKAKARRSRP